LKHEALGVFDDVHARLVIDRDNKVVIAVDIDVNANHH
jgi:hypothetical protein